ncbi:MAG: hypothetical protein ACYCVV_20105 [Acidimicrobiales bacterium]
MSPSAGPSASATPSADPTEAIRPTLLAAYAATYTDVEAAVREGSIHSTTLGRHAIPPALDQLQQGVEQYLNIGVVPVGVPSLNARIASVNLGVSPAQAVVAACPAAPRLVSRKTSKPVPFKALPANPVTVDLQTVQGHWVVSFFKVDRSKTCSA